MKTWRQFIVCLITVISLGIVIVFLLFTLSKRQAVEQQNLESKLPVKIRQKSEMMIRVLLKTDDFEKEIHKTVKLSAPGGLIVSYGDKQKTYDKGETFEVDKGSKIFRHGTITIETINKEDEIEILSLKRQYGHPTYEGKIELFSNEHGVVIINELPLESYLCSVVPSEMPSTYEMEALKVQAICARCYAFRQMQKMAYPEYDAHVNDSVSYQVYNNLQKQEKTNLAVRETEGQLLWYDDQVAMTYFYSTSSGQSTSVEAWGTKLMDENQYLKGVQIENDEGKDYEEGLAWYRWSACVSKEQMEAIIERNTKKEIGVLKNMEITKKGAGGIALELTIWGTEDTIVVKTENKIRRTLGDSSYKITKQDGSVTRGMKLLPSAFVEIEKKDGMFIINGGGYGHGIGMSQNGANELAKDGKNYKEILGFFYPGTEVKHLDIGN